MKRIALVAPGWLGDAVMALPAIADLRRGLPDASFHVIAKPSVAPLVALVPGMDGVIALEPRGAARREAMAAMARQRFDVALLLPNSFHSALVAWRAGIPERWGYRGDWRSPLLTRAVAKPAPAHQAALYQHLVAALGFPNGPRQPHLEVPAAARGLARRMLVEAGWNERAPLVALAPGAAYGGAKRWPAQMFAALATTLAGEGVTPVLVGSAGDRGVAAEVRRGTGAAVIDLTGRTDLSALAGTLVACRTLVTNDSGGMHVASALDVPVVVMFGPTNEHETRPLATIEPAVLVHDVWCRPCMLRECPLTHRCMRGISVDRVAAAVRRRL